MVKVDGNKVQEVKDHYLKMAENEIHKATQDSETELSDVKIQQIKDKHQWESDKTIKGIISAGPEKIFKNGFAFDPSGWRAGYTKQTVKKRAEKRRTRKKFGNKTQKIQRRK